ncbi:MAG: hypothetical protein HWN79_10990 [Candidatus Lokiarchaeota archaeon]|nr:hypothetical protein [Candidatus Lokiarchaeota archaeon]
MSKSESTTEKKYRYVTFHGEDVRTKRFQKKINRKPTLVYVILTNIIMVFAFIFIIWLLVNLFG